ncbi:AMP-binding protein [Modestobacter sp. I12A-02628]|uniref:AMP-binding protein n=1 Tax=Goekera deserti TaxID=2497753 RepID=A0A7K3WG15_9ACTN|nr:AMP-binding protein [Goekera deserti]NDI47149.1 AMP-binding protein [Goekera deserti]NEL55451.1 AMP-binding protein [Goekera deserti]
MAGVGARADDSPDGPGLADDTVRLTWREVARHLDAVGGELLAVAPGPDARVAVTGENTAATLLTHAAGILTGVGTVAVSRQLTAAEMADQFRDAGVVAAVTGPAGLAATVAAARATGVRTVVVHGTDAPAGTTPWAAWTGSARTVPATTDRPARPPLVYTSGTTGRARGTTVRWAPSTVTDAAGYAALLAGRSGFPPGPHLVVGPLQHNGPLTSVRHLLSGQPVVVLGRFDPERVLQLVQQHRVASTVMVPTHFTRLLALPEDVRRRFDVSSLRSVAHTGSACPPDVKRAMIAWFGPVLVESYGGSEIGTVCRISSDEWLAHPGSVGRVVPPFEVVVLDEQGRELPPGQTGLLGFRTPPGREVRFHADEDKTRAAHPAPGVATLGDVGHVTADGFVYVTDRVADMVVSGGVNLYPAESEQVLQQHPAVADVAVIGVPDADLGETLRALVVADGPAPAPAELDAWCRARLAAYKCPRGYTVVESLPRTVMGKLDKRALRRPFWDGERTIAG